MNKRNRKKKTPVEAIVDTCQHLISSSYEDEIPANQFCPDPATHLHEGRKYCERHFHVHAKGVVQWDEYGPGDEEYGEQGQDSIDFTVDADEEDYKQH
jgi:hypothetical protein